MDRFISQRKLDAKAVKPSILNGGGAENRTPVHTTYLKPLYKLSQQLIRVQKRGWHTNCTSAGLILGVCIPATPDAASL